jgi:hypothetical protein
MSDLLNPVTTVQSVTEYDRSFGGAFDNPLGGAPSLTFNMQRVAVRDSDGKLMSASSKPNVSEPYIPGKIYAMYDPTTGSVIPGVTFTADQMYAMLYSVMRAAVITAGG